MTTIRFPSAQADDTARCGFAARAIVILAAIEPMNHADTGGHRLSFDAAHHNGSRFVDITMIGADGHHIPSLMPATLKIRVFFDFVRPWCAIGIRQRARRARTR